jgi:hypothetical protein
MSDEECRRAILFLANFTGWPLSELERLSLSELREWVVLVPKPQ